MEPQRFGQPSCATIAGGMIAILGAALIGISGYHLATGIPLMEGTSKFTGGEQAASMGELWFGVFGGLPFLLLGLSLVLVTANSAITIDDKGIIAANFLRSKVFRATWQEITSLERIDSRPGSGYKLVANGKTLLIQNSTVGINDLISAIKRNSPNLPTR